MGVFGIAGIIGLFVFASYRGDGSSEQLGVGAVTVWGILPASQIDNALSSARQINRELEQVKYIARNPDTFSNDLATAIATGNAPDAVLISQEHLLSVQKFLTPISNTALPASTFSDTFTIASTRYQLSSGTYGIPILIDPLVLFENRTLLSSSGIAKPPATWEALTGMVPRLTTLSSSGKLKRQLIALGTYDNIQNARGILSAIFLQTGVPISVLGINGYTASLGGVGTSGQAVVRFYTQFADPSKISYTWDASLPNSRQAFLSGDLALYIGYASEARYLRQANPNLNFSAVALPQPQTSVNKKTYGLIYALGIPRGSKNPSGAFQVGALLTSTAQQLALSANTGIAPATRDALGSVSDDPTLSVSYGSALYADAWLSPPPSSTDQVFSVMIKNVTSGRLSLSSAISTAERALTSVFP